MKITPDLGAVPRTRETASPKEMLSLKHDPDNKIHVRINSSSLSILLTCMRKAEYALHLGYKSKTESNATLFGTAIHKALEVFYSGMPLERLIPPKFEQNADLLLSGQVPSDHLVYRAMQAFLKVAEPLHMLEASDARSLDAGINLLTHYFLRRIDDPFEILRDAAGPLVERRCEAVFYEDANMRITLFGTIDAVLKNYQTGVVLPTDHKTTSRLGEDFYNRLKPNHQYTAYVWLAQQALGLECDFFLVNALEVKARAKTSRGTPPKSLHQTTRRTAEDIEDLRRTVVNAVTRYVEAAGEGWFSTGDVNACAMYGKCTYLDVCSAPASLRQTILDSNYTKTL